MHLSEQFLIRSFRHGFSPARGLDLTHATTRVSTVSTTRASVYSLSFVNSLNYHINTAHILHPSASVNPMMACSDACREVTIMSGQVSSVRHACLVHRAHLDFTIVVTQFLLHPHRTISVKHFETSSVRLMMLCSRNLYATTKSRPFRIGLSYKKMMTNFLKRLCHPSQSSITSSVTRDVSPWL